MIFRFATRDSGPGATPPFFILAPSFSRSAIFFHRARLQYPNGLLRHRGVPSRIRHPKTGRNELVWRVFAMDFHPDAVTVMNTPPPFRHVSFFRFLTVCFCRSGMSSTERQATMSRVHRSALHADRAFVPCPPQRSIESDYRLGVHTPPAFFTAFFSGISS